MKTLAAIAVAALGGFGSAALAWAPPPNDDCSNARTVTLGENSFTNVGATIDQPPMCVAVGADVWFKFQSTFTGTLTISTCGNANFNTVISAYSGCGCGTYTLLGCSDNTTGCSGGTSKLSIAVQAGSCYRIRVAGYQAAQGTGILTLTAPDLNNAVNANRILSGADAGDQFGFSVSGNGRIGTGSYRDIVVGAPLNDTTGIDTGRAYAFKGPDFPPGLMTKTGAAAGNQFGFCVVTGCDVNKDGRDDVIVGAPLNGESGKKAGRVYAYSGFNGALLWQRGGTEAGEQFGFSVACAGDVNADGYPDVIVGAPYNKINGAKTGRVYILSGKDGKVLKKLNGEKAGDFFGWSVAGIGDLNNDGKDDYAVGAPRFDLSSKTDAGRVYIYSGTNHKVLQKLDGDAAGDRFGTAVAGLRFTSTYKYDMVVVGAPFNKAAGSKAGRVKVFYRNITSPSSSGCPGPLCLLYTINGGNAGDQFGSSVAVGDLGASTFADIIIGAPMARFNGTGSGAVYVFNGANGALMKRVFGEAPGDQFGYSVAAAGDVNRGGIGDLLVGAPMNSAAGANAGRAYLFFMDVSGLRAMTAESDSDDGASYDSDLRDPTVMIEGELVEFEPRFGDVNLDGKVDADDLAALISAWGPCGGDAENAPASCPADLDGDGAVNVSDLLKLLDLLSSFGSH